MERMARKARVAPAGKMTKGAYLFEKNNTKPKIKLNKEMSIPSMKNMKKLEASPYWSIPK